MPHFVVPPCLQRGDLVRLIAPSGPFDRTLFWRGLGWLSETFRVRFSRRVFERAGFLAGSTPSRLSELNQALRCPDTKAVIAVRGGYGSAELALHADFGALRSRPKWLVGFSDVTALHVECQRLGIASLHAHNLTGLGRGDAAQRQSWLQALSSGTETQQFELEQVTPGRAQGPLLGGNLTLIHQAALADRWRPPSGAILFVEEVAEAPYRIARLLLGLEQAGVLDALGAIVVGDISPQPATEGVANVRDVFRALARRTGLPLGWGLRAGHERVNTPLILGAPAEFSRGKLRLF